MGLGGAFATPGGADEHDDEEDDDAEPMEEEEMEESPFADDFEILNFARTLEFLEARFYEEALNTIGEDELLYSSPICELGDEYADLVWDNLWTIQEHEESHAETLGAVIEDLGGEAVEEPEFEFGTATENTEEFLATAVTLEDTGVSAYAGAAPFIENEDVVPSALGIHSVEGRHASYVRALDQQVPYPEVIDQARTRSEVEEIAADFLAEDMEEVMDAEDDHDDEEADYEDDYDDDAADDGEYNDSDDADDY